MVCRVCLLNHSVDGSNDVVSNVSSSVSNDYEAAERVVDDESANSIPALKFNH